ncbi:cyclin-dependent kinase-activating kinase assembly factor-related / CDK-activating kinase assembly factor-like protein isoform X2 [Carex rostrata]
MVAASGGNQAWTREINIRRRIANIYNKREDDFSSLRDYNDYLEEVEDMTCRLIDGIDAALIEAKIAKYQQENAEQITNNRARKAEELAAALKACKANATQADPMDLGAGQGSQGMALQGQYAPAGGPMQPRPMGMGQQPMPLGAPHDSRLVQDDEETKRLRARAGGWTPELSKKRALEEAFSSIWI